jgi:hypothetical protein
MQARKLCPVAGCAMSHSVFSLKTQDPKNRVIVLLFWRFATMSYPKFNILATLPDLAYPEEVHLPS